ncbi:MAG: hypothetical protein JJD97_00785 [Gemmatimonadaceae bacterium]|nr:hypothetical protein [Gemmatimonadaceae bacterium]
MASLTERRGARSSTHSRCASSDRRSFVRIVRAAYSSRGNSAAGAMPTLSTITTRHATRSAKRSVRSSTPAVGKRSVKTSAARDAMRSTTRRSSSRK